jgi:acrylyl-CoA reductase (NADPH)
LARDLDIARLEALSTEIPLSGAIGAAERLLAGHVRGRIVIPLDPGAP